MQQIVSLNINWCHFNLVVSWRGCVCVCVHVGGVLLTLPVSHRVPLRLNIEPLAGQPEQQPEPSGAGFSYSFYVHTALPLPVTSCCTLHHYWFISSPAMSTLEASSLSFPLWDEMRRFEFTELCIVSLVLLDCWAKHVFTDNQLICPQVLK